MHEVGIAQQVLQIVESRAREHGDGRVRSLRLCIGELSGVEPQSLQFALDVCSQGTRAEGMSVEIRRVPALLRCRRCSHEHKFDEVEATCPACGSNEMELVGGDDLHVESFEMD